MTAGRRDDHEHAAAAATLTIGSRVGALVAESARSLLLGQFWRRAWRCDCGERFVGTELRAFRELACPACVRRAEANVAASYDPCPHGHEPSVCEQCRTVILDAALGHRAAGSRVEPPTPPIVGPRNNAPALYAERLAGGLITALEATGLRVVEG